MAYNKILFNGEVYLTKELFTQIFSNKTSYNLIFQRGQMIFNTLVCGPLNEEEKEKCSTYTLDVQDIDKELTYFLPAEDGEEKTTVCVIGKQIYEHKDFRFLRFTDLPLISKYRLQNKLPIIRIGGRGMYVCLDRKNIKADKPIILSAQ